MNGARTACHRRSSGSRRARHTNQHTFDRGGARQTRGIRNPGNHEIDPTARRKPGQNLKSAAPGAPFGWTSEGTPYVGTQYAVKQRAGKSFQFASLSTRNGAPQFYWKDLAGVSQKVALSALETHGSVEALLAGESSATIGNILEPEQLEAVRAVFKRLVGAETLARFAVANAADDDGDVSSPPPDDDEDEDEEEAHEEEAKPLDAAKSSGTKKEPTAPGPSSSGGSEVASNKKRKARMALVDELKREAAEAAAAEKAEKKAKSNGVRLVD